MTILQEILEWSQGRPAWQRDALHRLILKSELSAEDIRSLADICKSGQGLIEHQTFAPLSEEHVQKKSVDSTGVSLVSIFHHHGVNSLAEDQTLNFGTNLTVVYGDNGAGKTGYIRILKSACRARGQEEILGGTPKNKRSPQQGTSKNRAKPSGGLLSHHEKVSCRGISRRPASFPMRGDGNFSRCPTV